MASALERVQQQQVYNSDPMQYYGQGTNVYDPRGQYSNTGAGTVMGNNLNSNGMQSNAYAGSPVGIQQGPQTAVGGPGANAGNFNFDWLSGGLGKVGGALSGSTGKYGLAPTLMSGILGAGNIWMGMKQYGLAKKQLKFGREAFNRQMENQAKTTNAALLGQAEARYASNKNAYAEPSAWMDKHAVSGRGVG